MILQIPKWLPFPQLRHGFGTRHSNHWTHQEGRTWVKQTHSSDVLRAEITGCQGEGDALVTNQPGLLLEIRTADCLPILFFDPVQQVVAAAHSGWKGTRDEIAIRTVEKMVQWYGSETRNIHAAIGPSIGQCCFEVGPEVSAEFGLAGRIKLNLGEICFRQLKKAGLQEIIHLERCTMCEDQSFYSFRREKEIAGRMEAGIGLLKT